MKRIPLAKRAIALPLIGWIFTWAFTMLGAYVDLVRPTADTITRPSAYVYFIGFALAAFTALISHGWASKAVAANEADTLARASLRFSNLMVVLGLAVNTIYAFGNFMGAFALGGQNSNVGQRFLWAYLPILLATAVVVYVVLKAFVFRTEVAVAEGAPKAKMSERQKALALGYSVPILSTAFAVIFGLFVYDATRTNLDVWIWVLIIAIVGFGVIAGTRFSARARQARVEAPKPKTALAAGAATLNFVLSIVFGGVVGIMSFVLGQQAIQKLQIWKEWQEGDTTSNFVLANPDLTWYLRDFAPSKILIVLATVGVYLSITERHRKRNESKDA